MTQNYVCSEEIASALKQLFPSQLDWAEIRGISQDASGKTTQKWYQLADGPKHVSQKIAEDIANFMRQTQDRWNWYIGRAGRDEERKGDVSSIGWVSTVSIDLDSPLRPKDSPASNVELETVKVEAMKVVSRIDAELQWRPMVVMTGNGYQLWYSFIDTDTAGRKKWLSATFKNFEQYVLGAINQNKVKLDPQHDLARIVKLPGTLSMKGIESEDRLWRMAEILQDVAPNTLSRQSFFSHFGATETTAEIVRIANVPIPERFWFVIEADPIIAAAWSGSYSTKDVSPSGQDMALVYALKRKGFSASESAAVLRYRPGSKAGAREDYVNLTVRKVYDGV